MNLAEMMGASKSESSLLVLYIPSADREEHAIDQEKWVGQALEMLGGQFGRATAFPQGRGVWRDDLRGGQLVHDAPVVFQCYTNLEAIERGALALRDFLLKLGTETNQGAVGFVVDREYIEIRFPLRE